MRPLLARGRGIPSALSWPVRPRVSTRADNRRTPIRPRPMPIGPPVGGAGQPPRSLPATSEHLREGGLFVCSGPKLSRRDPPPVSLSRARGRPSFDQQPTTTARPYRRSGGFSGASSRPKSVEAADGPKLIRDRTSSESSLSSIPAQTDRLCRRTPGVTSGAMRGAFGGLPFGRPSWSVPQRHVHFLEGGLPLFHATPRQSAA